MNGVDFKTSSSSGIITAVIVFYNFFGVCKFANFANFTKSAI
jgi:hypothetical protein